MRWKRWRWSEDVRRPSRPLESLSRGRSRTTITLKHPCRPSMVLQSRPHRSSTFPHSKLLSLSFADVSKPILSLRQPPTLLPPPLSVPLCPTPLHRLILSRPLATTSSVSTISVLASFRTTSLADMLLLRRPLPIITTPSRPLLPNPPPMHDLSHPLSKRPTSSLSLLLLASQARSRKASPALLVSCPLPSPPSSPEASSTPSLMTAACSRLTSTELQTRPSRTRTTEPVWQRATEMASNRRVAMGRTRSGTRSQSVRVPRKTTGCSSQLTKKTRLEETSCKTKSSTFAVSQTLDPLPMFIFPPPLAQSSPMTLARFSSTRRLTRTSPIRRPRPSPRPLRPTVARRR
jgi:hypothetical protein